MQVVHIIKRFHLIKHSRNVSSFESMPHFSLLLTWTLLVIHQQILTLNIFRPSHGSAINVEDESLKIRYKKQRFEHTSTHIMSNIIKFVFCFFLVFFLYLDYWRFNIVWYNYKVFIMYNKNCIFYFLLFGIFARNFLTMV